MFSTQSSGSVDIAWFKSYEWNLSSLSGRITPFLPYLSNVRFPLHCATRYLYESSGPPAPRCRLQANRD